MKKKTTTKQQGKRGRGRPKLGRDYHVHARVERSDKRLIRSYCEANGLSETDVVIMLIRQYLA